MKSDRYLALLRGINVGGNNIIKMSDLKASFEKMGFTDVSTYIQSGNVIFTATEKNPVDLCNKIEKKLSADFGYQSKVAIVTFAELTRVIEEAPSGFGTEPEKYRYDVIFFKDQIKPQSVMPDIKLREGVDTADCGSHTLYFSRLISKAGQSYLKNVMVLPAYKLMTIRNWNTTKKLSELM
jgi:uncharacterized protein (DUF1697 family)